VRLSHERCRSPAREDPRHHRDFARASGWRSHKRIFDVVTAPPLSQARDRVRQWVCPGWRSPVAYGPKEVSSPLERRHMNSLCLPGNVGWRPMPLTGPATRIASGHIPNPVTSFDLRGGAVTTSEDSLVGPPAARSYEVPMVHVVSRAGLRQRSWLRRHSSGRSRAVPGALTRRCRVLAGYYTR